MKQTFIQDRHQQLQRLLIDHSIQCVLISNPVNCMYLTGKWGLSLQERDIFLVITPEKVSALISPLVMAHFSDLSVEKHTMHPDFRLSDLLNSVGVTEIHFEASDLRVAELESLQSKVRAQFTSAPGLIETLRLTKDTHELELLKKAGLLAAQAWEAFEPLIQPGKTEKQLAEELRSLILKLGADGFPEGFEPIIASGAHSAVPHHQNTDKKIENDEVVLVDFGCSVHGYASDMTRTIWIGENPSERFKHVKQLVDSAYEKALRVANETKSIKKMDQAVADFFQEKQVGEMIHTLGHGIGLSVHEGPSISRYAQHDRLEAGNVITIEPGLYYENEMGYRYENTVAVTADSLVELTKI